MPAQSRSWQSVRLLSSLSLCALSALWANKTHRHHTVHSAPDSYTASVDLSHAASLPLRGLNGAQQPAFAPVNMSAFRGMSGSRKRQPSVDNLKALAGS